MSTLPEPGQSFYGRQLVFNARNHRYYWGGEAVPSVTTIIGRLAKPLLVQWAANCAVDYIADALISDRAARTPIHLPQVFEEARKAHLTKKDEAADIGTRVHKYAQMVLQGQTPPEPIDGPAQMGIEAFWRWVESHKIEPYAVERRVMSRVHHYAGTCDFYGRIDGRLAILDFKTGKGVYDEAWWQTSAYAMALYEELPELQWMDRWVIHLDKTTGEMTAHCRNEEIDHVRDMAVWRGLLEVDKAIRAARKHPQPKKRAA